MRLFDFVCDRWTSFSFNHTTLMVFKMSVGTISCFDKASTCLRFDFFKIRRR